MKKLSGNKKILRLTSKREEEIIETYKSMHPEEIAYFFTLTNNLFEKDLMMRALNRTSKEHREKTVYYINHPIELQEKLSKLEKKTK